MKTQRRSEGHVAGQSEQKISKAVAGHCASRAVARVLPAERERTRHAFIARVQVVHIVVKIFKPEVNRMVTVGPGRGVFQLDRGVVENLDAIRAAQAGERSTVTSGTAEGEARQNRAGNARDAKICRQVDAGWVRKDLVVRWEILEAGAELVE